MLALIATSASAQILVDGKDIAKMDLKYIEIVAKAKAMSLKVKIIVDYGQEPGMFSNQKIEDLSGRPLVFNSVIAALNYLYAHGWKCVNNYAITSNSQNYFHYLLEKREQYQ